MAGGAGLRILRDYNEGFHRADVVITKASTYDVDLSGIIRRGLVELGLGRAMGARQVGPAQAEPGRAEHEAPHINTHPAVVRAVAEVFRYWGRARSSSPKGQGHCRDTDYVLEQSASAPCSTRRSWSSSTSTMTTSTPSPTARVSPIRQLTLPVALRRADLVVSLPKMKTHHWAGVTLAMKNLFGVMPGVVLRLAQERAPPRGIAGSILDINAAVRPHLAIVDGIVAMEGDGPIMGTPKAAGLLVMGTNLPAVDATPPA